MKQYEYIELKNNTPRLSGIYFVLCLLHALFHRVYSVIAFFRSARRTHSFRTFLLQSLMKMLARLMLSFLSFMGVTKKAPFCCIKSPFFIFKKGLFYPEKTLFFSSPLPFCNDRIKNFNSPLPLSDDFQCLHSRIIHRLSFGDRYLFRAILPCPMMPAAKVLSLWSLHHYSARRPAEIRFHCRPVLLLFYGERKSRRKGPFRITETPCSFALSNVNDMATRSPSPVKI